MIFIDCRERASTKTIPKNPKLTISSVLLLNHVNTQHNVTQSISVASIIVVVQLLGALSLKAFSTVNFFATFARFLS
jgi:hypothetical protein